MSKVYIVARCNVEGIQSIESVHKTDNGAKRAWRELCDKLIQEEEQSIEYELGRDAGGNHWVWRSMERIDYLKTYDYDLIDEKLYPCEGPAIIESELKK